MEEEDKENCPIGEDLCERLNIFHERLMQHVSLKALLAPPEEEVILFSLCFCRDHKMFCF